MLSKFVMIRPIYYNVIGSKLHLSVGLFNSTKNSSTTERELDKIFQGAFIVPYSNGSRISFDSFQKGNLKKEIMPNFSAIKKELKKMLKKDYYRIQVGYYAADGYEKSEQNKIDILKENGYKLTEEKKGDGRYLVSKIKYKTWGEVQSAKKMVEGLIGDHCFVKRYYNYKGLKYYHIHYLTEMYLALIA